MSTKAEDGYQHAVKLAIEYADIHSVHEYYRGMAAGLCRWAGGATEDQWSEDKQRIADAREKTTMTEGV